MTEKRFVINSGIVEREGRKLKLEPIIDCVNDKTLQIKDICNLLNQLNDENKQLKQKKENWKSVACSNTSFNSILLNELSIAQEQGYKVSDPFKRLMEEKVMWNDR